MRYMKTPENPEGSVLCIEEIQQWEEVVIDPCLTVRSVPGGVLYTGWDRGTERYTFAVFVPWSEVNS